MQLSRWNVGLEIYCSHFLAVAVQKKRYGWQLRGWWQIPFADTVFNRDGLFNAAMLIKALRSWRRQLPKYLSVRTVFPESSILQQPINFPAQKLSPPELEEYVIASVNRLFPLSADELAVDYRIDNNQPRSQLLVTAARKGELTQWINAIELAGLNLDAVDIAPCIVRSVARSAGIAADSLLLHRAENGYLLISPLDCEFHYERLTLNDESLTQSVAAAQRRYHQLSGRWVKGVYVSGEANMEEFSDDIRYWSPFSALQQIQPPIPQTPSRFTVSCGLAIRESDNDAH